MRKFSKLCAQMNFLNVNLVAQFTKFPHWQGTISIVRKTDVFGWLDNDTEEFILSLVDLF